MADIIVKECYRVSSLIAKQLSAYNDNQSRKKVSELLIYLFFPPLLLMLEGADLLRLRQQDWVTSLCYVATHWRRCTKPNAQLVALTLMGKETPAPFFPAISWQLMS